MRTNPAFSIFLALTILCISACATSTNINKSDKVGNKTTQNLLQIPDAWKSETTSPVSIQVGWLEALNDDLLLKLVEEAQSNNTDLQIVATNVENSRALANQAKADLLPTLSLQANSIKYGEQRFSAPGKLNLAAQSSWEIDVWGRIRSSSQATKASLAASEADYKYAQHSLAARVVSSYITAIEAFEQVTLTEQIISTLKEVNRIVQIQFENGIADQQDLSLVRSDLNTAQAALANNQGAQRNAIRALEVLLGRYPEAELNIINKLPELPTDIPAGIPSELLERRPDLIAAESRIAVAFNRLEQAKAARLPTLSLSGSYGGTSSSLASLLDPANIAWQAASSLLTPLLDGGIRKLQVEIANNNQEVAIASYRQAALNAFAEVESALDQRMVLRQQQHALQSALLSAQEALRISKLQYNEGEISLIDVLTIQQRVAISKRNLLSINSACLQTWVGLNLALGGGWSQTN